jgi:serine/threonine-protein kinase
MRLDAWLKQPHTPVERLRLVERLAQALNAVHDRGETLASIAPERVEVGSDLKVDLAPAGRGRPEPGYAAPERLEGGPPTTASDIYSVGALCWEILMGRPCGEAPRPLAEIAPELPRELANSVMGCLEKGAEWRPKDLTYLAQLAAAQQKAAQPVEIEPMARAKSKARPERTAAAPRSSPQPRSASRRESRSLLPLFVAAVLLVAAAAGSYYWLHRQGNGPSTTAAVAPPPTQPAAVSTPDPAAATPTPAPAATAAPAPTPTAVAPTAAPTPRAVATAAQPQPESTPVPTPPPTPTPAPDVAPTPAPRAVAVEPVEPPALSTLSPLSVKRPGRVLLDIRGTGLRSDLRVSILPLKETPRGISVVRQKWTNANLVSVLLELDNSVAVGAYGIALEDGSGNRTNPLTITITK